MADPATGEILFDEGHVLTRDEGQLLDAVGVGEVTLALDNGTTMQGHLQPDVRPEPLCGL